MDRRLNLTLAVSRVVKPAVLLLIMLAPAALAIAPAASARDRAWPWDAARGAGARWNLPAGRIGGSIAAPRIQLSAAADFNFPGEARTIQVGGDPVGDLVDPSTHTVYVANGNDNTVSVINDSACNAWTDLGCGQTPPTVAAGQGPLAMALDPATHTLYVSDFGASTVAMINTDACSALHPSGCEQVPATVTVGSGPALIAFDRATGTVYVPNANGNTVSVIDAATCNAIVQSGCSDVATATVGSGPDAVAVDDQTHTVYAANWNDVTMSLIDSTTCNGTVRQSTVSTTRCARKPGKSLQVQRAKRARSSNAGAESSAWAPGCVDFAAVVGFMASSVVRVE